MGTAHPPAPSTITLSYECTKFLYLSLISSMLISFPSINDAAMGAAGVFKCIGFISSSDDGSGNDALIIISASSRSPQEMGLKPIAFLPRLTMEDNNNLVKYVFPTPVSVPVINRFTGILILSNLIGN